MNNMKGETMPAGDRTGPQGMGPKTGRGAGYCAGYDHPGYANPGFYGGYGRRAFGRRPFGMRGFRHMRYGFGAGRMGYAAYPAAYPPPAPLSPEEEQEALKAEETWLQEQLDAVRSRMAKEE